MRARFTGRLCLFTSRDIRLKVAGREESGLKDEADFLLRSQCRNFNHWKYGPLEVREAYLRQSAASGWQALEDAFARKNVVYLLGTADVDPHEKDLDVTCAGERDGGTELSSAPFAGICRKYPLSGAQ